MNLRFVALVLLALSAPAESLASDQLVVVATRYLQMNGISHSHLYLYDWNGQLVRQLTDTQTGQDIAPVFSSDGREIVFQRQQKANDEWWMIETSGRNPHQITQPPEWYAKRQAAAPRFALINLEWERYYDESFSPPVTPQPKPNETPKPTRLVAPDHSIEIILDRTGDDEQDYDGGRLGSQYRVRSLKDEEESLLGSWQNFETLWDPLHLRGEDNHFFLIEPPLRTVFFYRHLNSTDGTRVYGLDFQKKRVIPLSTNGATPVPISGEPFFFAIAEERYRPLGDGRAVNCSYLDLWNAQLEKRRFGSDAPAVFYGACFYSTHALPLVIRN